MTCCGRIVHNGLMCTRVYMVQFEYKYGVVLLISFTRLSIKHSAPIQFLIQTLTSLQSFFATSIATLQTSQSISTLHLEQSLPKHSQPTPFLFSSHSNMCFFDQYVHECGDYKWGPFRQHCAKEYRTGETCGMKLIMQTYRLSQKCKICDKMDTKFNRRRKEEERIKRWKKEGGKKRASIEAAEDNIKQLDSEIHNLMRQRQEKHDRL